MTDREKRVFDMNCCSSGKYPPELMDSAGLSEAYNRLSVRMKEEFDAFLESDGSVTEIIEELSGQGERWYTGAVLMSVEGRLSLLDRESRDITLSYLFDMMYTGGRSIRRSAAEAAGKLIASACGEDMSVWTDFLHRALFMKAEGSAFSRGLAEDPLRIVLLTVCNNTHDEIRRAVLNSYASYFKSTRWDTWTCLRLISGIFTIPYKDWGAMQRGNIGGFIRYFLKTQNPEVQVASLRLLKNWLDEGWRPSDDFQGYLTQALEEICSGDGVDPAEICLIMDVVKLADIELSAGKEVRTHDSQMFQDNLRSDHSWLFKLNNLNILKNRYRDRSAEDPGFALYASHLLTLLRLNPNEMVFDRAGEDLLDIADVLSEEQKYEIFKELFKVIETGYDETGYLPGFLGRLFCRTGRDTQTELIADIQELTGRRDARTVAETLETVCCIARTLSENSSDGSQRRILEKLCGFLSQGLYSDLEDVPEHILYTAGTNIFKNSGSDESFADLARNILICMEKDMKPDLLCHTVPCGNIAAWLALHSERNAAEERPVAFYQGSFDPFTNGHHAIVSEIAEMGFQVYVNVHDFSLNRNVQPLLLRRQMAAMSVMDLAHVQLFPEEITVNMDNSEDLAALKNLFPKREIWIVAGNDKVENDPMYLKDPHEGSVHYFPHIVCVWNESIGYYDESEVTRNLKGEVITLRIPAYYENMTSSEVRSSIREGKSADGLVIPQVGNLIKRTGMYGGTATFKPDIPQKAIDTEYREDFCRIFENGPDGRILRGEISFVPVTDNKYNRTVELTDMKLYGDDDLTRILLDETLMSLQGAGVRTAVCKCGICSESLLKSRGFVSSDPGAMTVDMDRPLVVFTDIYSCFRDNFNGDERLKKVCEDNAQRLMTAAAGLFPGSLVLNVDTEIMNYRLSSRIMAKCAEEGGRICVPFGKILKSVNIPGVSIMPLNTEKRYDPDLRSFRVCEKDGYPVLRTQMRTIRSMNRDFVLVDDLYHRGYRIQKISESLNQEGMKECGVIVGVLSSRGEKTARESGHVVEAAYEVPDMRLWIIESDMIPFFGSDRLDSSAEGMRHSIYPILPYQFPSFLKEASYEAVYKLSLVCMENAVRLFETAEQLYREKYNRSLTFARIRDVIEDAGFPEIVSRGDALASEPVSGLLKGEIIRLRRMDPEK